MKSRLDKRLGYLSEYYVWAVEGSYEVRTFEGKRCLEQACEGCMETGRGRRDWLGIICKY